MSFFYTTGKHNSKFSDVELQTTDKPYNQLQHLTDDDTLITTLDKPSHQHTHHTRAHQPAKITNILAKNSHKIPLKRHKNKSRKIRIEKLLTKNKQKLLEKIRHSKNWLSRIANKHGISKKVIERKSRDDGTYEDEDDDENIQSKDENEDEDVQLIIIPKKPRKHLRPKIQDEDKNDGEEFQESDDVKEDSGHNDRISGNDEPEHQKSDNSEFESENFNSNPKSHYGKYSKNFPRKSKSADDDATLTLERVAPEDDDDDTKNNHESDSEDYDLHLKVKDKSGTHVKLSGDLPGNIGKLMAVGEDGGKVQIKNTGRHSSAKTSEDLKIVNSQGGNDDTTTDEMAQNLIKMKSGKMKHSPYPSTILLKPDGGGNENLKLTSDENSNENPVSLKTPESDDTLPASTLTPLTRGEANAKAEQPANQQPSNNIFAPMEFENGDDELMATSRLLDIAQKADDVSSLKDVKDPPSAEKVQPKKSLKDLTKG